MRIETSSVGFRRIRPGPKSGLERSEGVSGTPPPPAPLPRRTHHPTWQSFHLKARHPRHLGGGSGGLGLQLPRDPFFLGLDLGAGWLSNEKDWDNYSVTGRLRTLMGYRPMRYFSVFGGLTYNFEAWPGTQRPNLNPGSDGEPWGDDIRAERWTGFFLGVRL